MGTDGPTPSHKRPGSLAPVLGVGGGQDGVGPCCRKGRRSREHRVYLT